MAEAAQLAHCLEVEAYVIDRQNFVPEDRTAHAVCGRVLAMCLAGYYAGTYAITYGMVYWYTDIEPWQAHEAGHIIIFVD
jgi:hypothetical protein